MSRYKYPVFTALHHKSQQLRLYIGLFPKSKPSESLRCIAYHPKLENGRWTVGMQENAQSYYDCSIRELGWFSDPDLFKNVAEGVSMEDHPASIWDIFLSRNTRNVSPMPYEEAFSNWTSKLLDTLDLQYGRVYSNRSLDLALDGPGEQVLRSCTYCQGIGIVLSCYKKNSILAMVWALICFFVFSRAHDHGKWIRFKG